MANSTKTIEASPEVILDRKSICKSCPTKKFFKEARICLKSLELMSEITKLKANSCPDKHWK